MSVTVYSTGPSCMKCRMTVKNLTTKGIDHDYEVVTAPGYVIPADVQPFFDEVTEAKGSAPVVVVRDESGQVVNWWNDFRPDKITALVSESVAA